MSESTTEEATVNPDGSQTFEDVPPPVNETTEEAEEIFEEIQKGIDPAVYFLIAVAIIAALWYFFVYRKKREDEEDDFFQNVDGEKVRCSLTCTSSVWATPTFA
jgi:hypothetical protein